MRVHADRVAAIGTSREAKTVQRRRGRLGFRRPRLGQNRFARHTLLQEQLRRLHARVGVEARDEHGPSAPITLASATSDIPW